MTLYLAGWAAIVRFDLSSGNAYAVIFDDAGDDLHTSPGLTPEFHRAHGTGTMDLENHFNYLHEVVPGDCVAVYMRLVAYSAKRVHCLMFLVNETRGKLAAIFECINGFADLKIRKTASGDRGQDSGGSQRWRRVELAGAGVRGA